MPPGTGGRGRSTQFFRWDTDDGRRLMLFMAQRKAGVTGVTDTEIHRVKQLDDRWKDGKEGEGDEAKERMLYKNFRSNYMKTLSAYLQNNPQLGTDQGVNNQGQGQVPAPEEDDDGIIPDIFQPNSGNNGPTAPPNDTAANDLSSRLEEVTIVDSPGLTTKAVVRDPSIENPDDGTALLTSSQLIYTFGMIEDDDSTPFTGVGVIVGPVPKGLLITDIPVKVTGRNNDYLVIVVPRPAGVLQHVPTLVNAFNTKGKAIERGSTRYQGISEAVKKLDTAHGIVSDSVLVVKLPFKCNTQLFEDDTSFYDNGERAFPAIRFLEFLPEDSEEGEGLNFLHVQLRSFAPEGVVPQTSTANIRRNPTATVRVGASAPPPPSPQQQQQQQRRPAGRGNYWFNRRAEV